MTTPKQIKRLAGAAVQERLAVLLGERNALAVFPTPTGVSAQWASIVTEMRVARPRGPVALVSHPSPAVVRLARQMRAAR